jgi:hypothetical protein
MFTVLLSCIAYIDDIFGGGGNSAKCMICTKISYNGHLTNWTISHFFFYMILAMLCPDNLLLIIGIGVMWEFIELYFEYSSKIDHDNFLCRNKLLNNCSQKMSSTDFWNHYLGFKEHKFSLFWCSSGLVGQLLDIAFDILGAFTGVFLVRNYF